MTQGAPLTRLTLNPVAAIADEDALSFRCKAKIYGN
jgi:hypothetical protein